MERLLELAWEVKVGSCWLYGDLLTTERRDEADVSLSLDPGRLLCFDPAREDGLGETDGGIGERPGRR